MIRVLLVISYIFNCIRLRVAPWKYFQLNAPYFNEQREIFSKLDMDQLIPERWRLQQCLDTPHHYPDAFPVFIKPEWGQNAHGIARVDNRQQLEDNRASRSGSQDNFLIQQAAPGRREIELFVIPAIESGQLPAVLSITETLNASDDPLPINSINNKHTSHRDITDQFSAAEQQQIWRHLQSIGQFKIARFGIRADSTSDLLAGKFHIIEINVFVPMPLVLIADNVTWQRKIHLCLGYMHALARITTQIPAQQTHKSVFFKKLRRSRALKLDTAARYPDAGV